MKHYIYRITNTKINKHYYGVRTSKVKPEIDLGVRYFSSSSNKEFIKDQKDNPTDYKYKIVKCFASRKDAVMLEIKLHNKFNVGMNESFYNKSKQTSTSFDTTGISPTENSKRITSKRCKGISLSDEHKNKISKSLLGHKHSEETLKKLSDSLKGKTPWNKGKCMSEDQKKLLSELFTGEKNNRFGTKHSEETLKKMRKPKEKVECPHCGKSGGISVMKRWHFENCKKIKG